MATAESVRKPDFQSQRKHFIFTDEHEQLRESIRSFAIKELAPHAEEWEETTFPDSVFRRMGELGFLGLDKPEAYGGQGGDYYSALVLAEELAHSHSGGLAMGVAVQTDMAMPPILAFGTEEQKQEWAAPAIAGAAHSRFCSSVPNLRIGGSAMSVCTATPIVSPPECPRTSSSARTSVL